MENAIVLGLYQIDTVLIVNVDDLLHPQAFLLVEQLLFLQDALVKKLLQFFVAVVDTKLFETVNGKILESSNIQNADIMARRLERNALVDSFNDKVKEATINGFG